MSEHTNRGRLRWLALVTLVSSLVTAVPASRVVAVGPTCANGSHTVVRGDAWSLIAQRYKVSLSSLLTANSADATKPIYPGNVVCLPPGSTPPSSTSTTTTQPSSQAPSGSGTLATCAAGSHTVASGDSWSAIAARYKVSLDALLTANGATASTPIYPGRPVCLPDGASSTTTSTTLPPGAASVTIRQFPVQGPCWFADTWMAPRGGGRRHEGVDLIARYGQYVYAADDGTLTIQYWDAPGRLAGNGWRLTRADGTYFFYAHLSAFAPGLSVGSEVVAGQVIGYIGSTGNSSTPHLHFEVHPGGGAAVNPTNIVRAVDGCKVTAPPRQPGGVSPPSPVASASPTTTVPSSTTTTAPGSTPVVSTAGPRDRWQFISPVTAFDGTLPSGRSTVKVPGLPGIAAGTPGVLVRVSSTQGGGWVSLHRCGAKNSTSTLNLASGRFNTTTAPVAVADGQFCVTSSQRNPVRLEVVAALSTSGVGLQPIVATRALDTRTTSTMSAGQTVALTPTQLGVPVGTRAVTATFTLVAPASSGTLAIGPCGGGSWSTQQGKAALHGFSLTVRISDAGLCVRTSMTAHLIVDVTGAWVGTTNVAPVTAVRAFDSRSTGPIGAATVALPAGGASRVMVTITAIGAGADSSVFAWPCDAARPVGAAAVTSGKGVAAFAVPLAGTQVCLTATAPVHVLVDLTAAG